MLEVMEIFLRVDEGPLMAQGSSIERTVSRRLRLILSGLSVPMKLATESQVFLRFLLPAPDCFM